MQIQLVGVLSTPLGKPVPNREIRLTALTTDGTVEHSTSTYLTNDNGEYDFFVYTGYYSLEVLDDTGSEYLLAGELRLDESTPSRISLEVALAYSKLEDYEETLVLPDEWKLQSETLINSTHGSHRDKSEQIVDDGVQIADIQEVHVADTGSEKSAKRTELLQAQGVMAQDQVQVFEDDNDISWVASGSELSTDRAEHNQGYQVSNQVKYSYTDTSANAAYSKTRTVKDDIRQSESVSAPTGVIAFVRDKVATAISSVLSMVTGTYSLNQSLRSNGTSAQTDSVLANASQTTSTTHKLDATGSEYQIVADLIKLTKETGIPTLQIDTKTGVVKINGKLQVSNYEDENGNPVEKPKDGDTIFQVFQYSDSVNGPWSDTLDSHHIYRRENYSINGVVDPATWGVPYRFIGQDGNSGKDGQTIYQEYAYSPDGLNDWTPTMKSGDKYRRERTVTDGEAGDWSAVTQIAGNNGSTIETRAEYSIDGMNFWHSTLYPDDKFERRAVFKDGVMEGSWSQPYPIGRGETGETAQSLRITATSQIFKFDSAGVGVGDDTITFQAVRSNLTDTVLWSTEPANINLQGESNTTKTLHRDDFGDNSEVKITIAAGNFTDSITVVRLQDGVVGKDGNTYQEQYRYNDSGSDDNATAWDADMRDTDYFRQRRTLLNGNVDYVGSWQQFRKDGNDGADGITPDPNYTWVRYADDSQGNGISNDPTGKHYIGFAHNKTTPTESDNPADYIWSLTKGETGETGKAGTNGTDGQDGQTIYIEFQFSSDKEDWHYPEVDSDRFMRTRTVIDSVAQPWNTATTIRGADGQDGSDGADADPNFTWVKYADNALGTGMSDQPDGKAYMGIAYNQTTGSESNDPNDYTWSKILGDAGSDGTDGDTYIEEYRYNATGSDTGATDWAGTPRDTDYYRQSRLNKNGQEQSRGDWHRWRVDGVDGNDGEQGEPGEDGAPGQDGISGFITNESHVVATDSNGDNGYYGDAGGQFIVYEGLAEVDPLAVEYAVKNATQGLHILINNSNGVYTVGNLTENTGSAELTATYKGVTITRKYTIVKSLEALPGSPGSSWVTLINDDGNWPGDSQAIVDFINEMNRTPILNDHLTYVDNANPDLVTNSSVKRCNSAPGAEITWSDPLMAINGDMIVNGTLSGKKLVADSITGNEISAASRIRIGSNTQRIAQISGEAADHFAFSAGMSSDDITGATGKFKVGQDGHFYAKNGTVEGKFVVGNASVGNRTYLEGNPSSRNAAALYVRNEDDETVFGLNYNGYAYWKNPKGARTSSWFRISPEEGYVRMYGMDNTLFMDLNATKNAASFYGTVYADNIEGDVLEGSVVGFPSDWHRNDTHEDFSHFEVADHIGIRTHRGFPLFGIALPSKPYARTVRISGNFIARNLEHTDSIYAGRLVVSKEKNSISASNQLYWGPEYVMGGADTNNYYTYSNTAFVFTVPAHETSIYIHFYCEGENKNPKTNFTVIPQGADPRYYKGKNEFSIEMWKQSSAMAMTCYDPSNSNPPALTP